MALSRRTFVEGKRYETVLFQENTHPGDFEMVEFQDIMNREREALAQNMIVDGFFGDSFKIVGSGLSNSVSVTPGVSGGYSAGRRLLIPDAIHPLILGQYIYNMAIATPATNRTDLVYLDIFLETVTSAVDPDIQDPILGPSAIRERVRYNFAVSQNVSGATIPTLPVGHVGLPLALITRRASDPTINAADVVDARPAASLNAQFKPKNLIIVSPVGGDFTDPVAALESIVALSSASNPYTILIMPGIYTITAPLTFNSPYVSMIGTDPDACTIQGSFSGLSVARISADRIVLKNLTLDFTSGSGSHSAAVFSTGAYNAVLENLVLAPFFYGENSANTFHGISTVSGGFLKVKNCTVYAQNVGTGSAAIEVGASSTMDVQNCSITAAASDCLHLANGGTLSLRKCSFVGNVGMITSAGAMTAKDCTWVNQTVKAFVTTGSPLLLTLGVTNTLVDCTIDCSAGSGVFGSMTDTSAIWTNVLLKLQLQTSGGGQSVYTGVNFYSGLDVNGTAAKFFSCIFGLGSGWGIGGSNGEALIVRGTTSPLFLDCMSDAGKCVLVLGGSPTFRGCRFTSSSASAKVINVVSTSTNVIVDGCTIQLLASYSLTPVVYIGSDGGSAVFTFTHNHVEGQAGGLPNYVLTATSGAGATLRAGGNTSTAGALRDPAITVYSNIEQAP